MNKMFVKNIFYCTQIYTANYICVLFLIYKPNTLFIYLFKNFPYIKSKKNRFTNAIFDNGIHSFRYPGTQNVEDVYKGTSIPALKN